MTTVFERELEQNHRRLAMRAGWFVEKVKGSRNGFPDRFYAKCGRIVLIEWKRPGGVLSAIQRLRQAELRSAGVEVHVIDNLCDANKVLGIE